VIAATIIEMPSLQPGAMARSSSVTQTSEQSTQRFTDSLHAAAKASAEDDTPSAETSKSSRRQKNDPQDKASPSPVHDVVAFLSTTIPQQPVVTQPVVLAQSGSSNDSAVAANKTSDGISPDPLSIFATAVDQLKRGDPVASGIVSKEAALSSPRRDTAPVLLESDTVATTAPFALPSKTESILPNALAQVVTQTNRLTATTPDASSGTSLKPIAPPAAAPTTNTTTKIDSEASPSPAGIGQPSTVAPDATVLASALIASQVATTIPLHVGLTETGLTGVSRSGSSSGAKASPNSLTDAKVGSKEASNDAELKPSDKSLTVQAPTKSDSQTSMSSADQSQNGGPSQDLGVLPAGTSFAHHALSVAVEAANGTAATQAQPTITASSSTSQADKAPVPATASPMAAPESVPVINTAKLIQSVGQSEMRVGINSTEFGNISIHTSASRDLISAQISVDHGDLAKALAVHLPEMQERLGSSSPANVRVDLNSHTAGNGTGTSGGLSQGNSSESRSSGQQSSGETRINSINNFGTRQIDQFTPAGTGGGLSNGRLDIRA
jgi:hypothetical protein